MVTTEHQPVAGLGSDGARASRRAGGVPCRSRRGVVLLEVVLALALFVMAALVVLAGLNSALDTAQRVQREAEAADLAVSLLSEIQMGLLPPEDVGPEPYEDEAYADWTWEVYTEPYEELTAEVELPEFTTVHVIVRHEPSGYTYRLVELMTPDTLAAPPQPEDLFDAGYGGEL